MGLFVGREAAWPRCPPPRSSNDKRVKADPMIEEAKDFVPEHLRAIRKDLVDMRREINGSLLGVEQHVVALATDVTNTNARLARIEDRLALIEKRLTKGA